ncbi:MAG: hypothetical protein Q7J35_08450, partial [Candidatus Methanoperedens sp.]|nr:hypothetical protein [Candidatus Methanoperedens sp.]
GKIWNIEVNHGHIGIFGEKIIFFLKNPENHETMDEFTMNLRDYPTISIQIYIIMVGSDRIDTDTK